MTRARSKRLERSKLFKAPDATISMKFKEYEDLEAHLKDSF